MEGAKDKYLEFLCNIDEYKNNEEMKKILDDIAKSLVTVDYTLEALKNIILISNYVDGIRDVDYFDSHGVLYFDYSDNSYTFVPDNNISVLLIKFTLDDKRNIIRTSTDFLSKNGGFQNIGVEYINEVPSEIRAIFRIDSRDKKKYFMSIKDGEVTYTKSFLKGKNRYGKVNGTEFIGNILSAKKRKTILSMLNLPDEIKDIQIIDLYKKINTEMKNER